MLGTYTDSLSRISLWSGEALITALKELSILSGYPELEYSALLFDGYSAGGQFSYHFTQWKPERVIAFVTMKGGAHSLFFAGAAMKVPGYMFIGENDEEYRITNLTNIFERNRFWGALWALAMEPDAGHERVSKEIIHSYFDDIISLRVPATIPIDSVPGLVEIDEEDGWLGNRETYSVSSFSEYPEDKTKACWFPNEKIAREWKSFVQGKPITDITYCGRKSPKTFQLFQNHPNPFNSTTTIQYDLPKNSHVELEIIDLLGRRVRTLISEERTAGHHQVTWNGLDDQGHPVASGVYLYTLKAEGYTETRKLLLIK